MSKDTGGTAFPYSGVHKGKAENIIVDSQGMTLRDYFAAAAIKTICPPTEFVGEKETEECYSKWAEKAYRMADAMLRAREAS